MLRDEVVILETTVISALVQEELGCKVVEALSSDRTLSPPQLKSEVKHSILKKFSSHPFRRSLRSQLHDLPDSAKAVDQAFRGPPERYPTRRRGSRGLSKVVHLLKLEGSVGCWGEVNKWEDRRWMASL
jgi:hypothetical protein